MPVRVAQLVDLHDAGVLHLGQRLGLAVEPSQVILPRVRTRQRA